MSSLEDLIYAKLVGDGTLAALLATWNGQPAVFVDQAPDDRDPQWGDSGQFPRVVFAVNRLTDPQRLLDGSLVVDIAASEAQTVAVQKRVATLLDGVFWQPTGEPTTTTRLRREAAVPELPTLSGLVVATVQEYDVVQFPSQATFAPDPIATLNTWTAATFGSSLSVTPSAWGTTSAPPVYWELLRSTLVRRFQQSNLWRATIRGHVITRDPNTRLYWIRKIAEALAAARGIAMSDGTYLEPVLPIEFDGAADPIRTGQVSLTVEFGAAIAQPAAVKIAHIYGVGETPLEVPAHA